MSKEFGGNGEATTCGISISADRTQRVHLPRRRGKRRYLRVHHAEGPGLAHGQHHPKAGKPRCEGLPKGHMSRSGIVRGAASSPEEKQRRSLPGREDELVVEPDREPKEELREH